MRRHAKSILELGIGFVLTVAILELFLVNYEILAWSALGIVFTFFALLIFNALFPLTNKNKIGQAQIKEGNEDEIQRLERLIRRTMQDGDQKAAETLGKRLKSTALLIASYRSNVSPGHLDDLSKHHTSLSEIIGDEHLVRLLTSGPNAAPKGRQEIEALLTALEGWAV